MPFPVNWHFFGAVGSNLLILLAIVNERCFITIWFWWKRFWLPVCSLHKNVASNEKKDGSENARLLTSVMVCLRPLTMFVFTELLECSLGNGRSWEHTRTHTIMDVCIAASWGLFRIWKCLVLGIFPKWNRSHIVFCPFSGFQICLPWSLLVFWLLANFVFSEVVSSTVTCLLVFWPWTGSWLCPFFFNMLRILQMHPVYPTLFYTSSLFFSLSPCPCCLLMSSFESLFLFFFNHSPESLSCFSLFSLWSSA